MQDFQDQSPSHLPAAKAVAGGISLVRVQLGFVTVAWFALSFVAYILGESEFFRGAAICSMVHSAVLAVLWSAK